MHGLVLEWTRCPDGVKLIDYGPPKDPGQGSTTFSVGEPAGLHFRYRSGRRAALHYDISNLEDPLVIRFVNARTDEGRVQFFSRFGLLYDGSPHKAEMSRDDVLRGQIVFNRLLGKAGGADPISAVDAVNQALKKGGTSRLTAGLDAASSGSPARLTLEPQSLFGFMVMEAAMVAANGARLARCQHCGLAFLTGPLTARRSHAQFCADRCRVAAMRARNAAGARK